METPNRVRGALVLGAMLLGVALAVGQSASPENASRSAPQEQAASRPADPYVVVLGIAQDGGYPQAGCQRECCAPAWLDPFRRSGVSCIAVVDPATGQRWLVDATPNFPRQLRALDQLEPPQATPGLAGILLTHAHIGHYAGLVHLGREVIGARGVPVYAMPRMREFLTTNGPWGQLVRLRNIDLRPLRADEPLTLNDRLTVTPLPVPHRDEYSETIGFRIVGPQRSVLYVPDVDKWERWDQSIEDLVAGFDVAYLDGTFFADGEVRGRSMSEVPHPFIVESMTRFKALPSAERAKIRFIHLNHTNPALQSDSEARRRIERAGFHVATVGERVGL